MRRRLFSAMRMHRKPELEVEVLQDVNRMKPLLRRGRSDDEIKSLLSDLESATGREAAVLVGAHRRGRTVAAACLVLLEWDSRFFCRRMGEVKWLILDADDEDIVGAGEALLLALLDEAKREHYAHLMCRVPAHDFGGIWSLEKAGFNLVDIRVVLCVEPDSWREEPASGMEIRLATDEDLSALQEIARSSFKTLRFAVDPFLLPREREVFFCAWARNLHDDPGYTMFVAEREAVLVGFVACSVDTATGEGHIGLLAVREESRRAGVATALLQHTFAWFEGRVRRIAVITQAINYAALRTFQRMGFVIMRTDITYCVTLPQERGQVL